MISFLEKKGLFTKIIQYIKVICLKKRNKKVGNYRKKMHEKIFFLGKKRSLGCKEGNKIILKKI